MTVPPPWHSQSGTRLLFWIDGSHDPDWLFTKPTRVCGATRLKKSDVTWWLCVWTTEQKSKWRVDVVACVNVTFSIFHRSSSSISSLARAFSWNPSSPSFVLTCGSDGHGLLPLVVLCLACEGRRDGGWGMASRGAMVAGSSGADYEHREQVAQQYQLRWVHLVSSVHGGWYCRASSCKYL